MQNKPASRLTGRGARGVLGGHNSLEWAGNDRCHARRATPPNWPNASCISCAPAYSAETAERILEQLRRGRTLIDVCRDHGIPSYGTVRDWVTKERHGFAALYREALRAVGARWARPTRYAEVIADCSPALIGAGTLPKRI